MTSVLHTARPMAPALGRAAAVAALCSAAVHLLLLDSSSLGSLVMLGMAAACLPCAWHLWRHPVAGVWGFTALVDTAMLVLHLQMQGGPVMDMPGMHSGPPPVTWLAVALVGLQLGLAGAAVLGARVPGVVGGHRAGVAARLMGGSSRGPHTPRARRAGPAEMERR